MFESALSSRPVARSQYTVGSLIAVAIHAAALAALIAFPGQAARMPEPEVQVAFMRAPALPPPPPPPPAAMNSARRTKPKTPKPVTDKLVMPKPDATPKPEPEPEPEPAEESAEPVVGGMVGGVAGGVAGGTVGGVVGGTLGGTGTGEVKPKNVPAFVIQRDLVRQTAPRLSEVFKNARRGLPPVLGVYKVCIHTSGRVYEVTAVTSVPGADEDIIRGIREGWEYKPQQVPVCFLYNIPIQVQ